MENWEWPCEHITSSGNLGPYDKNWVYGNGNNIIMIHQSEMFCKYCGAPRPAEKVGDKEVKNTLGERILQGNKKYFEYHHLTEIPMSRDFAYFLEGFLESKPVVERKKLAEILNIASANFHLGKPLDVTRETVFQNLAEAALEEVMKVVESILVGDKYPSFRTWTANEFKDALKTALEKLL